MRHLKKYTLFLAILVMAYNTHAQEANKTSFSLQEAIDYSLKHSPNYLNAELDYQSADYKRKEITGSGLPQINGSIDFKDYINIPTSLLPAQIFGGPEGTFIPVKFGTKYNATAGFSASQLIYSSDYIFGLKASKEYMNLSKISVTRTKSELSAGVTKAYYVTAITKDRIKTAEANLARTKTAYENTKAMNQQGFVELIDVERAELEYNNALQERDKSVRSLANIEAMLKFQMGYKIEDPITLTDSLSFDTNELQELSGKADISKRPDFLLVQSQQTLLDIDVKRLKWGYMPTLSAYGSYQYNAQRNTFNLLSFDKNDPTKQWFKVALVGLTLNVNIFDGLQRNYKIQQAKITSLKNTNTMKLIESNAEAEVITSSINYNTAYQSVKNQKRSMELALHVYDVAQKKYMNGTGSNLEVISAQTQVVNSQLAYYSVLYDLVIAKTDYLKATGNLVK